MELQRADPLYRQVYELLRRKILLGEHSPGEGLQESRVAGTLGVSRTPVREALRQLEREGLVVARGAERMVVDPTGEDLADLYACRAALERLVAERSARLANASDIEVMMEALGQAREACAAGDHAGVTTANTRFHDRMVESARMPPLRRLMDTIRGPILIARRRLLSDVAIETAILDEHTELLEAIQRHDVQRAVERMERHMKNDLERGISRLPAE